MECEACRELMLDVLYGEAEAGTRRLVLEHHAACSGCREELEALNAVRRDLSQWQLPEAIRHRRPSARSWRLSQVAVAASLLLSFGSLILGFARVSRAETEWRDQLARQQARHAEELRGLRASFAEPARLGTDEGLGWMNATMRRMVQESEARQAERFGARLADLREKTEAQRKYDLAQVSASLAYLEGKTGMQMARTTELMGHVLQASQKR